MATWVYPQLPPDQLKREEEESLSRELEWLLRSLQESLAALREGLQECAALLAPTEPGSTLVLSSLRSESVKGYVTRVGPRIVKGDVHLRLNSLPPPRGSHATRLCLSTSPTAPELILDQIALARRQINDSLDVVDVSTFTGDPMNANFISGQLRLLQEHIMEARHALKGDREDMRKPWNEGSADANAFDPPLPSHLSFYLSVSEAALVLYVRTLEPHATSDIPTTYFAPEIGLSGFSLRDRLFGTKHQSHDESGDVFCWNGEEVKVKEKVRVESQDPSLMAAMAKLTALEHEVAKLKKALAVVMGDEESDSD
ncbi:hypothetical protein D8B26_001376 [Coccidioides posadasii str. Silveira]|uniref:Uncharacterized protein n=3 Tax=Coccidioides posadasii TaxID=199306 RepID=E9D9Q1_COCPS|nr:hypothetical protein CPC735_046570 [Coccidioides posadasii C735 delta SOWgp]EER23287.1 hypothetical protein CPC735_046570 [Coccidioides posadasii C735 delta SOWgp]EFW16632.1 conserved hypothetical protein [Coccidioides posadasii str. Silveira]KMM64603.1 hypothetical protein CPAG_00955 [Coccidioides posadasii RMSCC 3488]QVM06669.1 hypothetical protein D8B26_001376 [Coccidioides posadasii str. Silveira]|eukprot:XP_003065432.1 hypothetical protein CPC735_046570 [Coccidioides posadasii C735 delta SOWgp]